MSNANPTIWQPIGPAPIQNPFYGSLNYASPQGSGQAAGAMHGLAVAQGGPGQDAWLYAASVNGGVWGRPYDSASDSWGSWRWLSEPPAYSGAQSITDLAVSPDQRWLAVGRGVFSNFTGAGGDIQAPLQLAERSSNGDLRWLRVADERLAALWDQPVQALRWAGNLLLVGTNQGLYVGQMGASGELSTLQRATALPADVRAIDVGPSGRAYAAFGNAAGAAVITATTAELQADPTRWHLLKGSDKLAGGSDNLRLAVSSDPGTQHDVVFLGTSKAVQDKTGVSRSRIEAIHRGSFSQDPTTPTWQSAAVGERIGTDQANPNFSFAADPTDATRVFAGGNRFPNFGGVSGLVAVQFADDGSHTLNYLGVPSTSPNHTSPHADSRDIAFLQTRAGLRILESDDGGIYQKGIELEAPWVSLNDGLRSTEVYAADWSHIGDLSIAAMQDNSVSIGTSGSRPTWLNVFFGDGSIARFDDGISGGDSLSRAYFAAQQYNEGQGLNVATFDANGIRKSTQYINLTVINQHGNPVSFQDYDYSWLKGRYPFYPPVETSAYRAGDYVMAGVRNVYEAIIPHWNFGNGDEILLRPLILDDPSINAERKFTAISVGSTAVQTVPQAKPHSWDVVYASFIAPETSTSKLYGRVARQADNGWLDPDIYGLKDLTPSDLLNSGQVITGITHNPDRPEQIYLTVSAIDLITTPGVGVSQSLQQPSRILFSHDGGNSWQTVASSGAGGLASNCVLQDLVFVPASSGTPAELFVSGFGGIWSASLNPDGTPSDFSLNSWSGLPAQQPLDLWTTDLNYDPVDGVLIASTLGQGSWLLQRQPGSDTPPAPPPGLSISSTMLPQELASYQNRKGRQVYGFYNVHLERSEANQNATVTVDLEFLSPAAWRQQLGIGDTTTLTFPPGVNDLTFDLSPRNKNITIPEQSLQARLTNAQNAAIAQGELSVRLYPNAETQGFYQEANGVFYAGESESIPLAVLLPAATLQAGDSLWWYKVDDSNGNLALLDAQGNRQGLVKPTDAQYLALVSQRLQPLGTASKPNDPLAFNAEQAKAAFDNPAAVLPSEQRSSGDLLSLPMTDLAVGQRFALALKNATGELQVSPLGFAVDSQLDTLASFTEGGLNRQVVLAAGRGELFVADPFLFGSGALSNQLTLTMDVTRVSPLASSYGLFRVDDLTGAFDTNGDGIAELKPGAPTYAAEALRRSLTNSLDGITGSTIPGYAKSVSQQVTLASSNIYAAYITPGSQMTPGRSGRQRVASLVHRAPTTDEIYFSIAKANGDGDLKHVSMGTGYFAFDDTSGGGDNDRNDLLLRLSAIAAPL